MKKILINACCGPCAISIYETDWFKGFESFDVYFNGDNFDSYEEYEKRIDALSAVITHYEKSAEPNMFWSDGFQPVSFICCEHCIEYRLRRTAEVAGLLGFDCFSTTLTVSPHKNTDMVNAIGRKVAEETGVKFFEANLKKRDGFKKTVDKSRELGLYRQNYCGCERSRRG